MSESAYTLTELADLVPEAVNTTDIEHVFNYSDDITTNQTGDSRSRSTSLAPLPFNENLDDFTGVASNEEIDISRSRAASVAPIQSCVSNVVLDKSKQYFIYIAACYGSSVATDNLTGYTRIYFCGELPENPPDNFVYVLPPGVTDTLCLVHLKVHSSSDVSTCHCSVYFITYISKK
jgi:hypothetical protein